MKPNLRLESYRTLNLLPIPVLNKGMHGTINPKNQATDFGSGN